MKKYLPLIGLLILGMILAAAIVMVTTSKEENKQAKETSETKKTETTRKIPDACALLTEETAKGVLGLTIVKGSDSDNGATSKDIAVSSCTYSTTTKDINAINSIKTATVLVRAAKTDNGADDNRDAFGRDRPQGAQPVDGIGDKAFWHPLYGQLNVLKGDNWYILTYGPSQLSSRTLNETKLLYDVLAQRL